MYFTFYVLDIISLGIVKVRFVGCCLVFDFLFSNHRTKNQNICFKKKKFYYNITNKQEMNMKMMKC